MLKVLFTIFSFFICVQGFAQGVDSLKLKDEDQYNSIFRKKNVSIIENADIKVIDGIIIKNANEIPYGITISRTMNVNNPDKLKKIGVRDFNKSYTFSFSDVTPLHEYVYSITELPLQYRDMNLPIIIGDKLLMPNQYYLSSEIIKSSIMSCKFIPRSSFEINSRVAYGAIKVISK